MIGQIVLNFMYNLILLILILSSDFNSFLHFSHHHPTPLSSHILTLSSLTHIPSHPYIIPSTNTHNIHSIISIKNINIGQCRNWTRGILHAKKALYHWANRPLMRFDNYIFCVWWMLGWDMWGGVWGEGWEWKI